MSMIKYTINNSNVYTKKMKIEDTKYLLGKYCSISGEKISKGNEYHLVINNFELFPNCWISDKAVQEKGMENCLNEVYSKYLEYKKMREQISPLERLFG